MSSPKTWSGSHTKAHVFPLYINPTDLKADSPSMVTYEEDFESVHTDWNKQYFDISFHLNRMSYQIQHRALEFVEDHNIHSILINNPKYGRHEDYEDNVSLLSGKSTEHLNDEQKMAVMFISESDNLLPYLLFGPAS